MNEPGLKKSEPIDPPPWWGWGLFCGILFSGLTLTRILVVKSRRAAAEMVDGLPRAPTYSWPEIAKIVAWVFVMGFVCGLILRAAKGLSVRYGAIGDVLLGILVVNALLLMSVSVFDPEVFTRGWFIVLRLVGIASVIGVLAGFVFGREFRKEMANPRNKSA